MQITVRHKLLNSYYGYYDKFRKLIVVDSALKNTWRGVAVILHEWGHFFDDINNKFYPYFKYEKLEFNNENWKLVLSAERSASENGYRLGKMYGLDLSRFYEELNQREFRQLYPFFRKHYFFN